MKYLNIASQIILIHERSKIKIQEFEFGTNFIKFEKFDMVSIYIYILFISFNLIIDNTIVAL